MWFPSNLNKLRCKKHQYQTETVCAVTYSIKSVTQDHVTQVTENISRAPDVASILNTRHLPSPLTSHITSLLKHNQLVSLLPQMSIHCPQRFEQYF